MKTHDVFILGNDKYPTLGQVRIPVDFVTTEDDEIRLWLDVHMISKPIEMLMGMNSLREWALCGPPMGQRSK